MISLYLTSNIPQFKQLLDDQNHTNNYTNNDNSNHSTFTSTPPKTPTKTLIKIDMNEKITKMISNCKVMEITRKSTHDEVAKNKPIQDDIIIKKGKISNAAALILNGKVGILAGKDEFYSELSSWSIIGLDSLSFDKKNEPYIPDFMAFVASETARILWITQTDINILYSINGEVIEKEDRRSRRLSNGSSNNEPNTSLNPLQNSSSFGIEFEQVNNS